MCWLSVEKITVFLYFVDEVILLEMNLGRRVDFVLALDDVRENFSEVDLTNDLDQLLITDLPIFAKIEVVAKDVVDRMILQLKYFIEELFAVFPCKQLVFVLIIFLAFCCDLSHNQTTEFLQG